MTGTIQYPVLVRKATLADLYTLLQFEQEVIKAERPFDETLQDEPFHYYDLKDLILSDDAEVLVAVCNGEIIGSGYARIKDAEHYLKHEQHAFLGFMYVVPAHRGMGVNQLVTKSLLKWAASRHVTEARLNVYDQNEPAVKAYRKIGFTKNITEMRMRIGSG